MAVAYRSARWSIFDPLQLLRRQVEGRAEHHPGLGLDEFRILDLGDAEVGHLDPPVLEQHHIGGLDVPVDHPGPVGCLEPCQHVASDLDDLLLGQDLAPVDHRLQGLTAQPLHGDVRSTRDLPDPVDRDDVRVVQGGRCPRLLEEPAPHHVGLVGVLLEEPGVEELQRDDALQLRLVGPIDDPHGPSIDGFLHRIGKILGWPVGKVQHPRLHSGQ
jgi:hypothetical protein